MFTRIEVFWKSSKANVYKFAELVTLQVQLNLYKFELKLYKVPRKSAGVTWYQFASTFCPQSTFQKAKIFRAPWARNFQ